MRLAWRDISFEKSVVQQLSLLRSGAFAASAGRVCRADLNAGAGIVLKGTTTAADQPVDCPFFEFRPVTDLEELESGVLGEGIGGAGQARFQRQVSKVRLGKGGAVRTNAVADEKGVAGVHADILHEFVDKLSLVLLQGDDDVIEHRRESALTNLVLLRVPGADGDRDNQEVVASTGENRKHIGEEFGLVEERSGADSFADIRHHMVLALSGGLAELAVGFRDGFGETLPFESTVRHGLVVDLVKCLAGLSRVESDERHKLGKLSFRPVEVLLAFHYGAVDIDEEGGDLILRSAHVAARSAAMTVVHAFSLLLIRASRVSPGGYFGGSLAVRHVAVVRTDVRKLRIR